MVPASVAIQVLPLTLDDNETIRIVDEAVSYTHLDVYKRQVYGGI